MQSRFLLAVAVLACAGCTSRTMPPPRIVAESGTPPILDSISFHQVMGRYVTVYPEFHFHSKDGSVNAIHREILSTDSPKPLNFVSDGRIDISPDQQKRGATYVGGWGCGPETYTVNLRAFLIDQNKNRSNSVDYTIHCPGM